MVDNQHQKIDGYRDLTQAEIALMNRIKAAETELGTLWTDVSRHGGLDMRWFDIARTHFEEGFMAMVRAVARPESRF